MVSRKQARQTGSYLCMHLCGNTLTVTDNIPPQRKKPDSTVQQCHSNANGTWQTQFAMLCSAKPGCLQLLTEHAGQYLVRKLQVGFGSKEVSHARQAALQIPIHPPAGCHVQRCLPILHAMSSRSQPTGSASIAQISSGLLLREHLQQVKE